MLNMWQVAQQKQKHENRNNEMPRIIQLLKFIQA